MPVSMGSGEAAKREISNRVGLESKRVTAKI